MRTSSIAAWLLLGLSILAVVVSRVSRSLGPIGIVITIAAIVVVVVMARQLLLGRPRPAWLDRRPATKNVTPHEPALPPGPMPSPRMGPAPGPSVIIVEPQDGTARLATRLQALDRLRADGLVTDAEYEAKRAKLIADF